ncbi:MAG: DUF2202 domain-containing protein [Gammaproteobacteria bacterium]|nr:DUF2202 domain-containing protein [Gammaproteobacteria bacterium]
MKYLNYLLLMIVLALTTQMTPKLAWSGTPELDAAEATHLVFMREEEKLARDVYLVFGEMYPDTRIFDQIAMLSEQEHTTAVLGLLNKFNIPDPNPMTDNLPESIGLFTGEEYGAYFLEKFNELVDWGSRSELDALYAGAFIEELDMHDIVVAPTVIAETDNGIDENGCGLVYTDEDSIKRVYEHLLAGSENHLRAFVGQIEAIIGEGNYEAQYLTQEEVDTILGR